MTEVAPPAASLVKTETVVSESIETEPVPVGSVQVQETNGGANGIDKTNGVSNGGSKKANKEVVTVLVDPKQDPIGWVKQQIPAAVHKINYFVLDWIQKHTVNDESKQQPLPGKNQSVTKSQFVGHLQDGTLLAQLANKLSPGSVQTVHEGDAAKDKENQAANLQGFINFAKEKAGLSDEQVFSLEDLQSKGKAGYDAVFNTIFQIATKAQEKFSQTAVDVEKIAEDAKTAIQNNFVQTILKFFKRVAPSSSGKQVAQQGAAAADENTAVPANNLSSDKVIEEVQVSKVEVTSNPPPIVAITEPVSN